MYGAVSVTDEGRIFTIVSGRLTATWGANYQSKFIMTTNEIKLNCGATIVTDKVCGKYYIKASQDCTGKNIIVLHSWPLKNIRKVRAFLKERLEMYDWTRELTNEELEPRYRWMEQTKSNILHRVQHGLLPTA